MTAPYSAAVAELLPGPLRHEVAVSLAPIGKPSIPLDVLAEGGAVEVTFSEDWAPYAQARVSLPVPAVEVLDQLDPRINVRLLISAGYTLPDNTREVFELANLGLRTRPVNRPGNTVELSAASDEARAQDYRAMYWAGMERGGINEAVRWLAGYAVFPETPVLLSSFGAGHGRSELTEIEVQLGDDYWSLMDDAASRTNTRVYCDEQRRWRVVPRATTAATPVHHLTVGEDGTIVTANAALDREEWFNAVCLRYRWNDAANTEHMVYGRAQATSGPYATGTVGHRVYFEEIPRPVSLAAANNAAAAKLRNLVTRGRSLTVTAAAAYWLRPGDTVAVTLPTGPTSNHLVQSVSFRPLEGLMSVTTRQPENITITTGE